MEAPNRQFVINAVVTLPVNLFVLGLLAWFGVRLGVELSGLVILFGALGWWLALLLRIPFMLALSKLVRSDRLQTHVASLSGFAEESVRLVILLLIGLNTSHAYSLGLGWAGIEVIYALVQALLMARLMTRSDSKSEQAKAFLRSQGLDKTLTPSGPYLGILERFSAGLGHLAFSLLLSWTPWAILATAPYHSLWNLFLLRLLRTSLVLAELVLAAIALATFVAALILTGLIGPAYSLHG